MTIFHNKKQGIVTGIFLLLELILYILLLTTGGAVQAYSMYLSIVVCFLYSLLHSKTGDRLLIAGLACTMVADLFLVLWSPRQQLWGMVFFLGAQTLYAIKLHRANCNRAILILRICLIAAAEVITVAVLKEQTDALAVISMCYYGNLIVNIIAAFARFKENKLFAIALVLFALCDTVIGLQVASGAYLPIREDSWLYEIIFMNFNLAWFFYLPSQVLIALSSTKK